jgi:hypothetical protein
VKEMDWITLITGVGVGGIVVKVLDVWWLQKVIETRDTKKWLRDQRLKAFTNLAQAILSFALTEQHRISSNPFEFYALAAEAMLLIDDESLINRIDQFIVSWDALLSSAITDEKQAEKEYLRLCKEGREIVSALRMLLKR